ncbi:MAG: AbrB/MazE/SpoVT family DNA-binding domain-containing protein [Planctomycetes bacterium]|nr:AbrB/MazE/SpoVT family DNA-binding domain-containing protein [Planctomycetota bacterium]
MKTPRTKGRSPATPAPPLQATARVSSRGQVVIPKALRTHFGIRTGQSLTFQVADRDLMSVWVDVGDPLVWMEGMLKGPGPSLVDELIEEHRRDAERENSSLGRLRAPGLAPGRARARRGPAHAAGRAKE